MKLKNTFFLALSLLIIACTPGPNTVVQTPDAAQQIAGFWSGLWHGFILLFCFILSLFTDTTIYEVHNNGTWYNFGYLLGVMFFFGGSSGGACSTSRKR